jgi:uncharacterized protein YggT (Ycf19 family)
MQPVVVFNVLQLVLGIYMWTLAGQGILVLLLREKRHTNPAYRIAAWVTAPVLKLTRIITPRFVIDAHIGFLAFFLLLVIRIGLYMLFYSQGWLVLPEIPPR